MCSLLACALAQEAQGPIPAQFPIGDVRNCPVKSLQDETQPLYEMEVLPGAGFDNLRNLDMGQVHFYNFSRCQISKDGKYLLPDNVFLVPVQESKVDVFAEYIDHWDNYTSMTSSSINFHAGFFSVVSGKFSSSYMRTKTHQVNDQSKTTRVQVRHKMYTVKLQPDAQLHPTFKSRIFDIAANLQNNNTEYAHYLAELLVRDYGTHYITSADAGALIAQTDFVRSSYVADSSTDTTSITASASADFFGKVSLGASFSNSHSVADTTKFLTNRTFSEVVTIGGPPFQSNFTLTDWERGVPDALVAIDRSGDPLHFTVTPTSLPELPETTVRQISNIVYRAINRYYKVNTRLGCTDRNSKNFHFQANLDDGSCEPPNTNFTFGGVYQTCMVDPQLATENLCTGGPNPAQQVNPITGDFSCPENYVAVKLHSGKVTHVTQKPVCNNVCHHCGTFGWSRCCQCQSILASFLSQASYEAYWCAALPGTAVPENSGYLFGGIYTTTTRNPLTGAMSCPRFFYPLHMGEDITVCVSTDYERGFSYSIPFAGFDSCLVGNPLADARQNDNLPTNWPRTCPHGYAQHLVTVDEGCEINFCAHAGAFNSDSLQPAKLPPFRKHPKYKANVTNTLVVFGVYGNMWVKNEDGLWIKDTFGSETGQALLKAIGGDPGSNNTNPNQISDGGPSSAVVAVASVVSTVLLGAMILLLVFTGRFAYKYHKAAKNKHQSSYMQINDPSDAANTAPTDSAETA